MDPIANSLNAQDQMLLKALQNFIIPFMQIADRKIQNDINQMPLGPEAGKLIIALQEFISSIIVRSQSRANNEILVEVGLVVEGNIDLGDGLDVEEEEDEDSSSEFDGDAIGNNNSEVQDIIEYQEGLHDKSEDTGSYSEVHSLPEYSSSKSTVGNTGPQNQDQVEPTFHVKLVNALRKHVFNTMPIRLLCFQQHGSSFQITLVERGLVYQRLESMLQSNMYQADHLPKPEKYESSSRSRYLKPAETEQHAIDRLVSRYTRYAILSHTWLRTSGEVTYSDWSKGLFEAKDPGYQKLVNFCTVAWKDYGLTLGWMDTVCINKESSSELDESIRSMYNWYSRAAVCITYLAETETISNMHTDFWFTRGWTFQELLAPPFIKFYDNDWKRLVANANNDKHRGIIMEQIKRATSISKDELHRIRGVPISRRMQLAASREVTREEDTAYSLMGIFDVSISTAYGEGAERAFFRLLQEILASPENVLDILNWAGELSYFGPHVSRVLPTSPKNYRQSYRHNYIYQSLGHPMEPLTLTHLGLRMQVLLMPAMLVIDKASIYVPMGDYSATVDIVPVSTQGIPNATYNLLDKRVFGPDGPRYNGARQLTLAVFNFSGNAASILIRRTCIAKVLEIYEDAGKVSSVTGFNIIDTEVPIVFDLNSKTNEYDATGLFYRINRDELAKHGMQLVSLCL